MKSTIFMFFWLMSFIAESRACLIITGILDGPLDGGMPKAIELYASEPEELELYTLWRSVNGAPFGEGTGSITPLSGYFCETFFYLVKPDHVDAFHEVFGNEGSFANVIPLSIITGNGNEGFQLRDISGAVVDQVWFENAEDSYRDSYWYRKNGTGPDSSWMASNWVALGNDGLDGLDAAGIRAAVPFGDYAIVWTGLTTDWNDPSNWSVIGIPGYETNVLIPDSALIYPVITNNFMNPARCKRLYLDPGSSVMLPSGTYMNVGGGHSAVSDQGMMTLHTPLQDPVSISRK